MTEIEAVRSVECDIVSDWGTCKRGLKGECAEHRTIGDICQPGGIPGQESRPCILGLGPWQWVGGEPGFGPDANCRFAPEDVNKCDGYKVRERSVICENDSFDNYAAEELSQTTPCGLIHRSNLVALTTETFYSNVPNYEPVTASTWSECELPAERTTFEEKDGKFWGVQRRVRRALCKVWPDVTVERACIVNCDSTIWGEWSLCSNDCGIGTQTRSRMCIHDSGMIMSNSWGQPESRACGSNPAQVMNTGPCVSDEVCSNNDGTQSACGAGRRLITVTLDHPNIDLPQCNELRAEVRNYTEPCHTNVNCPYWTAWTVPNMKSCHQEPSCLTSILKTRVCKASSTICTCMGPDSEAISCGPLPQVPLGSRKSTQAKDCLNKCPGATYSTRQDFVCSEPVEEVGIMCPGLVDIPGPLTEWDRECDECDTGVRTRTRISKCTNMPIERYTEVQQCIPKKIPAYAQWTDWDRSACTDCAAFDGAEMVRSASFSCPDIFPTQVQSTKCPMPADIEVADEWRTCSQVCWKDERLQVPTQQIFASAGKFDQCGSLSAAYSYRLEFD